MTMCKQCGDDKGVTQSDDPLEYYHLILYHCPVSERIIVHFILLWSRPQQQNHKQQTNTDNNQLVNIYSL